MSKNSKATARAQKAAELRAAQAKKEQQRRILTIGGVILAMVLIVGGAVGISLWQKNKDEAKLADAASSASEYGLVIGEDDAPHSVVIYEDFLCPFCGALERETSKKLTELAAEGKVQVEYRPFDLLSGSYGDYPIRATNAMAVVLEASGADIAKRFHDLLFENQPSEQAVSQNPDFVSDDDLVELAVEAGAVEAEVRPGIEGLSQKAWVDGATEAAADAGVQGTPTIILDGDVFEDGRTVQDLAANLIDAVD